MHHNPAIFGCKVAGSNHALNGADWAVTVVAEVAGIGLSPYVPEVEGQAAQQNASVSGRPLQAFTPSRLAFHVSSKKPLLGRDDANNNKVCGEHEGGNLLDKVRRGCVVRHAPPPQQDL